MWRVRATLRLAGVVALTATALLVWLLALPVAAAASRWRRRWRSAVFRSWSRLLLRLLGGRVTVDGTPPAKPFLLVSNHLGYLDVPVLASRLGAVFVAKADVRGWPVVGFLCRCMDTLFIDRTRKRDLPRVMAAIEAALAGGDGVVFFPEGTSSAGHAVGRFRPGLLDVAARSGHPVWYASLSYATPPGAPPADHALCWWGDMTFPDHVFRLLGLPGWHVRLAFGETSVRETDRKRLAERLQGAVESRFRPVGEGEEACA